MNLQISPITKNQWKKVLKALIYSFVSAFGGVWSTAHFALTKVGLIAALAAGINAVLVAAWQLFKNDQPVYVANQLSSPAVATPDLPLPSVDPVTDSDGNPVTDPNAPH